MNESELNQRFPRSGQYNLDWIREGGMGSHPLWIAEWLSQAISLRPGMRVLDLGCGKAKSSIFLAREFDVQVWATDLWVSPGENYERIRDAGLSDRVFPLRADAHKLPFAAEFFDVITALDCYSYFGTDDLYLQYLVQFVKPGGQLGIAGAGLTREIESTVPEHLRPMWTQDFWCLHSAAWWHRHWARTGLVDIELADVMPEAWKVWAHWQRKHSPDNTVEIEAVEEDAGRYLSYIRVAARRRSDNTLEPYCWPDGSCALPHAYEQKEIAAPADFRT
jgi:cyclopropane fatty-acyl-phospholipid synthase-like methyltransferase